MKTLLFSATLLLTAPALRAQDAPPAYRVAVGDRLTYHVEAGEKEYDFIITPQELGATVRFAYQMTEPASKTGTVTITPEAIKSATALYNYFSGGDVTLTDQTSVFLSADLYHRFLTETEVSVGMQGASAEPQTLTRLDGRESRDGGSTYIFLSRPVDGKDQSLDGPIFENEDGSTAIRIQETDLFPVITYLKAGFRVYLTSIERGKNKGR